METVAVLIKDVDQQYEGLRTSLGLLLEAASVQMYVLNHEIGNMDDAYRENMEFIDEMEGERFSNKTFATPCTGGGSRVEKQH